jgi:hypothetical protein
VVPGQLLVSPCNNKVPVWILDAFPQPSVLVSSLKAQMPAIRLAPGFTPANTWTQPPNAKWNFVSDTANYYHVSIPCTASTTTPIHIQDHGLFVAGLINQIAPYSTIWPVRVLNDNGAEGLASLLAGLGAVHPGTAVVNMSLVVSVPTTQLELNGARAWLQSLSDKATDKAELKGLLDQWYKPKDGKGKDDPVGGAVNATKPLHDKMQHLANTGVLFVAAAGNDSAQGSTAPRVPALYDVTLSVAAVRDVTGDPASYSNVAASTGVTNGIATLGGYPCGTTNGTGLIGLSTVGHAFWTGTSFATAFIAGLGANLLANYPSNPAGGSWTTHDRIAVLRGLPGTYSSKLNCPVLALTLTP